MYFWSFSLQKECNIEKYISTSQDNIFSYLLQIQKSHCQRFERCMSSKDICKWAVTNYVVFAAEKRADFAFCSLRNFEARTDLVRTLGGTYIIYRYVEWISYCAFHNDRIAWIPTFKMIKTTGSSSNMRLQSSNVVLAVCCDDGEWRRPRILS